MNLIIMIESYRTKYAVKLVNLKGSYHVLSALMLMVTSIRTPVCFISVILDCAVARLRRIDYYHSISC